MRKNCIVSVVLMFAAAAAIAYSSSLPDVPVPAMIEEIAGAQNPARTMRAFGSQQELKDFFRKLLEKQKRDSQQRAAKEKSATANASPSEPAGVADSLDGASMAKDEESITNTQHAGGAESGIVKGQGDHLVILRRGRLFTVRIGDNSLKPVASIDAFAPGINPSNDWYDEMLVSEDTIVVIGYSYGRGGTDMT